jgi:hypothetical protein
VVPGTREPNRHHKLANLSVDPATLNHPGLDPSRIEIRIDFIETETQQWARVQQNRRGVVSRRSCRDLTLLYASCPNGLRLPGLGTAPFQMYPLSQGQLYVRKPTVFVLQVSSSYKIKAVERYDMFIGSSALQSEGIEGQPNQAVFLVSCGLATGWLRA